MPDAVNAVDYSIGSVNVAKQEATQRDLFELVLSVISPALIMGLVGSLTFFLLSVGYRGEFMGQMKWTLFFYVFGAVLVARICVLMGNQYGSLYALGLGAVTLAATLKFVEGNGFLLSAILVLVIAGSSYLLTRDCTWMERPDGKGPQGLAAELNQTWQLLPNPDSPQRPRRHGLSIVWFSLASLPIFGIGQSMIPLDDVDRRTAAFWYISVYIACALGLLLTTALVGLRAYLKVRKLTMPAGMTTLWIAGGGFIILISLLVAALVPRPQSEFAVWQAFGSPKRNANKIASNAEKGGEGKGQPGGDGQKQDGSPDGNKGARDDQAKQKNEQGRKGTDGDKKSDEGQGKGPDEDVNSPPSSQRPNLLSQTSEFVQSLMRWIVIIFIVVFVLLVGIRGLAGISSRFRKWLERFLKRWERKPMVNDSDHLVDSPPLRVEEPVPLSAFTNPFADGSANRRTDVELVHYSFSALEAWANEHGHTRPQHETPIELAEAVSEIQDSLKDPSRRLAVHLARLQYSASHRSSDSLRPDLKRFWESLIDAPKTMNSQ